MATKKCLYLCLVLSAVSIIHCSANFDIGSAIRENIDEILEALPTVVEEDEPRRTPVSDRYNAQKCVVHITSLFRGFSTSLPWALKGELSRQFISATERSIECKEHERKRFNSK